MTAELQIQTGASPHSHFSSHPPRSGVHVTLLDYPISRACQGLPPGNPYSRQGRQIHPLGQSSNHFSSDKKNLQCFPTTCVLPESGFLSPFYTFWPHWSPGVPSLLPSLLPVSTKWMRLLAQTLMGRVYYDFPLNLPPWPSIEPSV